MNSVHYEYGFNGRNRNFVFKSLWRTTAKSVQFSIFVHYFLLFRSHRWRCRDKRIEQFSPLLTLGNKYKIHNLYNFIIPYRLSVRTLNLLSGKELWNGRNDKIIILKLKADTNQVSSSFLFLLSSLREDTHKKKVFF